LAARTADRICSEAVSEPPGEETRRTMALTSLVLGGFAQGVGDVVGIDHPFGDERAARAARAGHDRALGPDQGDDRSGARLAALAAGRVRLVVVELDQLGAGAGARQQAGAGLLDLAHAVDQAERRACSAL
jgi:hypothetical protein